ncbi:PAS domain-containing protein [Kordiimonas aquimaris]|uniref:PAS domain-containing protein n=1 Tax=Kordiimonas aquimaris TaxID=707591 RepID=UPI0021D08A28|nr:PAS domain-containing protein [Kordiimonas aquimaris]
MIDIDKTPEIEGEFSIELARERCVENKRFAEVLAYFDKKTDGLRLPRRADLNPSDLKPYLPEVSLFDLIYNAHNEVEDVYLRLLGTRLDDFYGAHTNKKISESLHPYVFKRILQSSRYCVDVREPIVVTADALSPNKDFVTVTILYVPFSTDGQLIDQVFVYNQVSLKSQSGN